MTDQEDDYELDESMPSFRSAVSATMAGVLHLGYGLHGKVADQSVAVRAIFGFGFWLFGNWAYNRITPPLFHVIRTTVSQVSSPILRVRTLEALGRVLDWNVQTAVYLVVLLLVALLLQNWTHTNKLNQMESILTTMTADSRTATDGGDERRPNPKGGLLFALTCGFIGWQFSPGGALAGFYLGWVYWKPFIDPEPSDVYVQSE